MIYDDLIAKMDDLDIALSNGFGKAETIIGSIKAMRFVIELHKPDHSFCGECSRDTEYLETYPCLTIQAIAKELQ